MKELEELQKFGKIIGDEAKYTKKGSDSIYNKNITRRNDLVLQTYPSGKKIPIVMVEQKPYEELIYNSSVIVLRPFDFVNDILIKYIYIMLNCEIIQNYLLNEIKENSERLYLKHKKIAEERAILEGKDKTDIRVGKSLKLSTDMLQTFKIPIAVNSEIQRIVEEYEKLQNEKKEMRKREEKFWNEISKTKMVAKFDRSDSSCIDDLKILEITKNNVNLNELNNVKNMLDSSAIAKITKDNAINVVQLENSVNNDNIKLYNNAFQN